MKITQEKLKEIIASHSKWLRGENGGEKADLSNVDLVAIIQWMGLIVAIVERFKEKE